MDFVSDGLRNGRKVRCLTIVDDYSRECPAIEVDTSINGRRVASVLDRLADVPPEEFVLNSGASPVLRT